MGAGREGAVEKGVPEKGIQLDWKPEEGVRADLLPLASLRPSGCGQAQVKVDYAEAEVRARADLEGMERRYREALRKKKAKQDLSPPCPPPCGRPVVGRRRHGFPGCTSHSFLLVKSYMWPCGVGAAEGGAGGSAAGSRFVKRRDSARAEAWRRAGWREWWELWFGVRQATRSPARIFVDASIEL